MNRGCRRHPSWSSPPPSKTPVLPYPWTAGAGVWTTSSSSAFGAQGSTRPSTSTNSPTASRPNGSSPDGSNSATPKGLTPPWMANPAEAYEKAIQRYRLSPTARLPLGRLRQTRKTCKRGLGRHDRSPGIHLISAASCPTNQDHLISPELPLQYLSLQNQRLHCNWTTSHRSSFLPQCRSSPECRNVLQF